MWFSEIWNLLQITDAKIGMIAIVLAEYAFCNEHTMRMRYTGFRVIGGARSWANKNLWTDYVLQISMHTTRFANTSGMQGTPLSHQGLFRTPAVLEIVITLYTRHMVLRADLGGETSWVRTRTLEWSHSGQVLQTLWASLVGWVVKNLLETRLRGGFDPWVWNNPLEKGMATHSSILAWRISGTE